MKMKSRSFLIVVAMLMLGTPTLQAGFYHGPGYYGLREGRCW